MNLTQKTDISSSTIFRFILIILGFWFVYHILDIVIMLFSAFVVASFVEPIAKYLDRYKIPRAISVLIVYFFIILLLVGLIGLMVEPIAYQTSQLAVRTPAVINSLNNYLPALPTFNQANIVQSLQDGLLQLSGNVTNISVNVFAGTRSVVSGVITFLFVFVIALYLVVERDALKKFARFVTPVEHYPYVASAIERSQRAIGRWVVGQVVLGVIIGILVGTGLWIIGVPYALLFGVLSGVLELIPAIGPFLAAIPGVLVALSQGWVIGLLALGWYTIVGQLENHVFIPNIMKRAVGLPPLITIIAVIIGARLLGIIGIIFAVPVATILSIITSDILVSEDELAG